MRVGVGAAISGLGVVAAIDGFGRSMRVYAVPFACGLLTLPPSAPSCHLCAVCIRRQRHHGANSGAEPQAAVCAGAGVAVGGRCGGVSPAPLTLILAALLPAALCCAALDMPRLGWHFLFCLALLAAISRDPGRMLMETPCELGAFCPLSQATGLHDMCCPCCARCAAQVLSKLRALMIARMAKPEEVR